MLTVKRQKSFIKDLAKVKFSEVQYAKYILYLSKIIQHEELPTEARDHSLNGEYQDTREFHIGGDLLIIYMVINDTLILIRIGSHSQLFQ